MTYREAADRIEEHAQIHFKHEYPHAFKITEALKLAVDVLREKESTQKCWEQICVGMKIYFVNENLEKVEMGEVTRIYFDQGRMTEFAVEFAPNDTQKFLPCTIGEFIFADEQTATEVLFRKITHQGEDLSYHCFMLQKGENYGEDSV